MDSFRLKPNEMMFFIDFNNTLVDYENEYDSNWYYSDQNYMFWFRTQRARLTKALVEFEKLTGLTPVICVITNASSNIVDGNNETGIFNDLYMTFLDNPHLSNFNEEQIKNYYDRSCEKYFKYLIYRDNDVFYKINPFANNLYETYTRVPFDEKALKIRLSPEFKKRESVERIMSFVDPKRDTCKFILFAGDNIKDDYPMKEIETPEGVSKIFIRPKRAQKVTPEIMREFAEAKGETFSLIDTRSGKRIKLVDPGNFEFLPENEKKKILDYSSGDIILLTQKNNRGLVDGINEAGKIIAKQKSGGQMGE